MLVKVHHIGYLVKNMAKAMESFSKLGFSLIPEVTKRDPVVSNLLKIYHNAPYHILL